MTRILVVCVALLGVPAAHATDHDASPGRCKLTKRASRCIRTLQLQDVEAWLEGGKKTIARAVLGTVPDRYRLITEAPFIPPAGQIGDCASYLDASTPVDYDTKCFLATMKRDVANAKHKRKSQIQGLAKNLEATWDRWRAAEGYKLTRWGMTIGDVKRLDRKAKVGDHGLLAPHGAAGFAGKTLYAFVGGKLASVEILFDATGPTALKALDRLRDLLGQKYGEPAADKIDWLSATARTTIGQGDLATAILGGMATPLTTWSTAATTITLTIRRSGLLLQPVLRYVSKDLAPVVRARRNEKALKDL